MYLDANFFVIMNFSLDKKGEKAREILKSIKDGKKAVTSALTLDEVMWTLIKNNKRDELNAVIEQIYRIKNLEVKEVSPLSPLRALFFMENYGLKPRDAFHAAVMESFGVDEIVTDDSDFDGIENIKRIKL